MSWGVKTDRTKNKTYTIYVLKIHRAKLTQAKLTQGRVDSGANLTSGRVDPLPMGRVLKIILKICPGPVIAVGSNDLLMLC